jgi:hypothetical protein
LIVSTEPFGRGFGRVAAVAVLLIFSHGMPSQSHAAGIFSGLGGSWRGDGSIKWTNGETERIRCQGAYRVGSGGNQIEQKLTCASDSTKLSVEADITYNPEAGVITGSWSETGYGVGGWVSGTANATTINARVRSGDNKFNARVSVVTRGARQTVSIRPQGLDVTEVSVTLRRR